MAKQLPSLSGSNPPPQSGPRDLFAVEVEQFLWSLSEVTDVKRVPDDFALDVSTSGWKGRVNLDNVFAESREMSPERRRETIAVFLESLRAAGQTETWDAARETFVPVIRGASYAMESSMKLPSAPFVRRSFLPYLDVIVAMDGPTSISLVTRDTVKGWNVTESDVFNAADARVPLLADPIVELYDETHGRLWVVASNDSYESSRVLVPGWLASFRGKVDGNPIAIIPERSTLMVGGDGRIDMIERLVDTADREFSASNRRLSPALYTVDEREKVVPYARAAGEALATKVKIGHEKLAIHEYRQQQEALEAWYGENGPDVFVARYEVFRSSDGSTRSLCIWPKGIRCYLPRTERIILRDPNAANPKATTEVAFAAIEDRLTRVPDLHPARFETTGDFPSEDGIRALAKSL